MGSNLPRICFLAMYPLNRTDRGPQIRISNLYRALEGIATVDLISGERHQRRRKILSYLSSNRLDNIKGLYVENSTAWAVETDVVLMRASHRQAIPVITYVRDAHPLFPDTDWGTPRLKFRLVSVLWHISTKAYLKYSDVLAFQSESFARLFPLPPGKQFITLPPAANPSQPPTLSGNEMAILYAGNGRTARYGVDILVNAVDLVRKELPQLKLYLITVPEEPPPPDLLADRPWISLMHLNTDEISSLLPNVRAVVIPFRTIDYHHLLIPIKLMDYLSYGRPILVTRCCEMARFVRENRLGFVVDDTIENMAEGIRDLFATPIDDLNKMGKAALQAVTSRHSWSHRAQHILAKFDEILESR